MDHDLHGGAAGSFADEGCVECFALDHPIEYAQGFGPRDWFASYCSNPNAVCHVHRAEYPSSCTGCAHLGWPDDGPDLDLEEQTGRPDEDEWEDAYRIGDLTYMG